MKAERISLDHAKKDKLFYFVANVVVVKDGRCLIMKRSSDEKVHPGKWAVPGGKLEWDDLPLGSPSRMNGDVFDFENTVEDLLFRETLEEAGIEIEKKGLKYINSVAFVRPDGIPVVLVKFSASYSKGEVDIETDAFDDFAWVDASEVQNYDTIEGIKDEVVIAINLWS